MPSFHPTQKLVFEKQSVISKFQLIAEYCQFFFLPLHHHPFLLTTTKKASAVCRSLSFLFEFLRKQRFHRCPGGVLFGGLFGVAGAGGEDVGV